MNISLYIYMFTYSSCKTSFLKYPDTSIEKWEITFIQANNIWENTYYI